MKRPRYTGKVDLHFGWEIETWYDRHTRLYVTQLKFEGNQIGDAIYGTKDGVRKAVDEKRTAFRTGNAHVYRALNLQSP